MSAARGESGSGGCLRIGCLGCLGIIAVPVLLVVCLLLLNVMVGREETIQESRELTRAIPPLERGQIPEEVTGPDPGVIERLRRETAAGQVRILLDVSELDFRLEPGPAGEPIRVESDFDTGSYDLSESLEPDDEYGWTYRLRFGPRRSWWLRLLRGKEGNNRVRLIVPRDVPLVLAGSIGFGRSRMELGGLRVVAVDLSLRSGEHDLRISEPLREPADSFRWTSTFGKIDISDLGNASARKVSVSHKAGEFRLDLGGDWRNDAEVEAYLGFGELTLDLPVDVHIKVDRAGVSFGDTSLGDLPDEDDAPASAPTIRLSIGGIAGQHRVRR